MNSALGLSGRNGAMLAVRDINENGGIGGRKVRLSARDDQNSPDAALAVDRAFESEGVRLIVGHMTSQMAEKTVPYINENQMLMISPTIAMDSLSGKDDFFFRVIPSNRTQAEAVSAQMTADGVRRAAVVIDKSNLLFSQTFRDFFVEYFQAAGGEMVVSYTFEGNDVLSAQCVGMLREKRIDGVLVVAASDSVALFAQRLLQLGLKTRLYSPAWAMTADLPAHGGSGVEGAQFVNYYDNTSDSPAYLCFCDEYTRVYGGEPGFGAYLSYEAMKVLTDAISQCGSTKPEDLVQTLKSREFQGLDGPIVFDEFGDMDRRSYIYEISGGQYRLKNAGECP
jgi:branched-chain amino acid transport system substrate-binding protein